MVCFGLTTSSWTQQEFLHFSKISFKKKYLWEKFATGKTESAILWENGMLKVRLFQFALAMNNASDNHMRVLLFWRCWRLIMGLMSTNSTQLCHEWNRIVRKQPDNFANMQKSMRNKMGKNWSLDNETPSF